MEIGWSHKKRLDMEKAFYAFLNSCHINSKDSGNICLGENLYLAQTMFITAVFDGLERGIHKFYVLKSRQLGLSTISRALSVFYIGMHDGLQGALVLDTGDNKESAHAEITDMLENLPDDLGFPEVARDNRQGLTLVNQSKILFKQAGVKKSKQSGTLGRSVGLSMSHLSEICSYDNDDGLEAFENSLSDKNPDRLYIYESTARGFNRWHEMWVEARADTDHCVCLFLGWWAKNSQVISRTDPDFQKYGLQAPTEREIKKIKEVKETYGVNITPEQLAWVRRKMDPAAKTDGDAPVEYEGSVLRLQEQPWTEDDSFQFTGSIFFAPEKLTQQAATNVSRNFQTFMYMTGIEFVDTQVMPAASTRHIELKVWDAPDADAEYIIGVDPAFGDGDEKNDRSAIQVMRAYADGLDQVAEYAWPLINTRQFAWVVASLLGWYSSMPKSKAHLILEINGPVGAVWTELKSLKHQLQSGYQPKIVHEKGLRNVFQNVRNYVFSNETSLFPTYGNEQLRTTPQNKVGLMERLRDFTGNGMIRVRSKETLEEMKSVTREGAVIKAQGSKKDDRVMAMAFTVKCWEDQVRRSMMTQRRTRENEIAKRTMTVTDQVAIFQRNQLEQFFKSKAVVRVAQQRMARRAAWRYR